MTRFAELIADRKARGLHLVGGLDVTYDLLPEALKKRHEEGPIAVRAALEEFQLEVTMEVEDLCVAMKPNYAFAEGEAQKGNEAEHQLPDLDAGHKALRDTMHRARLNCPDLPWLNDRKAADIGNTNQGTVKRVLDIHGFGAMTINPYMGWEGSLDSFIDKRPDKHFFALCRTSNPGADDFQKKRIVIEDYAEIAASTWRGAYSMASIHEDGLNRSVLVIPQFLYVAWLAVHRWNTHGNVGLVVGATDPRDLEAVCQIVAGTSMLLLIPGSKTQGGRLEDIIPILKRYDCMDQALVNISRDYLFPRKGEPPDGMDFAANARLRLLESHNKIIDLLVG